jgi:hypothetical protein
MVDVRLLYPPEKTEAAGRLAAGIAAAGYRVEREALADGRAFPDVAAEAGKAKVLLLIWSRGLVSAAMEGNRLALARRLPNLIEISADGIEPAGAEASPVVLLSGWRGQPYHQGWQRILADVKRLCGARETPRRSLAAAPSGTDSAPTPPGNAAPKRRPVRAAIAAGALIAATVGAGALYRGAVSGGGSGAETPRTVASVGDAPRSAAAGPSLPAGITAPAQPAAALPAGPPPAPVLPAAAPVEAPTAERSAQARPAATRKRSRPQRLAATGREVKRYSRKHSKTMRLFCQRSGRSTPQCRTFARSMREADG